MIQIPDDDFYLLLDRVATVAKLCEWQAIAALNYLAKDGGDVDVRRLERAIGESRNALRQLAWHGLAEREGRKWRFKWRGLEMK